MPLNQDDESNIQHTPSTKKEEEKRKHALLNNVLKLKPAMIQHPVISTLSSKYIKQQSAGYDESSFKLDLLRMLALYRLNKKN